MLIRIQWEFRQGNCVQKMAQKYVAVSDACPFPSFLQLVYRLLINHVCSNSITCHSFSNYSHMISCQFDMQVWAGPLSRKRVVVVLWNRGSSVAPISVTWRDIGLSPYEPVVVRDLWAVCMHLQKDACAHGLMHCEPHTHPGISPRAQLTLALLMFDISVLCVPLVPDAIMSFDCRAHLFQGTSVFG